MGVEKSGNKFSKDGSVVRITMKNFMTYKHETIWPGKKKRTYIYLLLRRQKPLEVCSKASCKSYQNLEKHS
jgi:hypothetical protein